MQSYKNRFKDNLQELLDYTKEHGRFPAMTQFDIRDYKRFIDFLTEVTHDTNFGVSPINRPHIDYRPPDVKLFQKYARKISNLKTLAHLRSEGKKLDREIEDLERQLLEAEETLSMGKDYIPYEVRI